MQLILRLVGLSLLDVGVRGLPSPDPGARAVLAAFAKGSRDVQGAAFYDPRNLAVFHRLPASLLRTIPHYDYDPDLRVDRKTLADMQRVFREFKILAYAAPLNTADMVARL